VKKAGIVFGILALLAAGVFLWAYYSLDLIVKMTLEHYGPDVLGVSVKVSGVQVSTQSGEGRISGVDIGNPAGFSASRALKLGEIRVAIAPATLTQPVVVIRDVAIDTPLITYERGRGGGNLEAIQKNIEGYVKRTASDAEAKGGEQKDGPRRFIVERISIRGAKVTMTNPALHGQGVTFDLPNVELRDVGKRENGLRASQVADIVARELIARIAQRVLTNIDLLRKGGVEGAIDALKGLVR
jgi:hypothetical protein